MSYPTILVAGFWPDFDCDKVVYLRYLSQKYGAIFLTHVTQDTHIDLIITSVFGLIPPQLKHIKTLLLSYEDYQRWGVQYKAPFDLNVDYAIVSNTPTFIPFTPRLKKAIQHCLSNLTFFPLNENPMIYTEGRKNLSLDTKSEFCSFVFSNTDMNNSGVKYRTELFQTLNAVKPVHSRGPYLNNCPQGSKAPGMPGNPEYTEWNKKYKFTICGENMISPGYFTEKIALPYLSGSIPIYSADDSILRYINPDSMIFCGSRSYNDVVKEVIELDNDPYKYNEKLRQPMFRNDIVTEIFDIKTGYTFIDEIMTDIGFESLY